MPIQPSVDILIDFAGQTGLELHPGNHIIFLQALPGQPEHQGVELLCGQRQA
jgi:hypothetical protein